MPVPVALPDLNRQRALSYRRADLVEAEIGSDVVPQAKPVDSCCRQDQRCIIAGFQLTEACG